MVNMLKQYKYSVIWAGVLCWLIIIGLTFWWFEFKINRQVDSTQEAVFDSRIYSHNALSRGVKSDGTTVIHYFDISCPCTRFNTPHVRDLIERYSAQGVNFLIRAADVPSLRQANRLFGDQTVRLARENEAPAASPSAIVITGGEVNYIGPYSPEAVCSTAAGDFVGLVLDDLLANKPFKQPTNLAMGCFCEWPSSS